MRRRFVSEAKAVAKLRHAGIVDVYDVSDEDDIERYLVVELIRGTSLRQVLQEHDHLPPEVAATMVTQICDAVEHAHTQGDNHRDIKPENVLIELPTSVSEALDDDDAIDSQTGVRAKAEPVSHGSSARSGRGKVVVKLTDFGIAKVLDAQGVTSTGQILGSPAHMAPEQIEGGEVGPHTDVFALGVDQILTVEDVFAGGRVAGEGDAGAGFLAGVAEDHSLDIDGGAPLGGDAVFGAVNFGAVVVP